MLKKIMACMLSSTFVGVGLQASLISTLSLQIYKDLQASEKPSEPAKPFLTRLKETTTTGLAACKKELQSIFVKKEPYSGAFALIQLWCMIVCCNDARIGYKKLYNPELSDHTPEKISETKRRLLFDVCAIPALAAMCVHCANLWRPNTKKEAS